MRVKAITVDLCVLDRYFAQGLIMLFDNVFIHVFWFQWKKEFYYLFTALGLVCRVKNFALYRPTPGKHVYMFADCDDVPVIVII